MIYLKYLLSLITPACVYISLVGEGVWTYTAIITLFVILPGIELVLKGTKVNLVHSKEKQLTKSLYHDSLLVLISVLHFLCLYIFLDRITNSTNSTFEIIGLITAQGLSNGIIGINVAHELGHRNELLYQNIAKLLLMTSLYGHFRIEHNKGHHRHVATPNDPATSRRNENLYFFWIRSIVGTFISACRIESKMMKKNGHYVLSLYNEVVQVVLLQTIYLLSVALVFGSRGVVFAILAAIFGFLLLETVNYIEHYGLVREKLDNGRYEKTTAIHSWNSNHPIGRMLLFELSRHSDHHYVANRPYQVLRHHDESPQMPTGYPGMMLLSLVPPVWFKVMNSRVDQYKKA